MRVFPAVLLLLPMAAAPTPSVPRAEQLHYNVNWPSGLTLGEVSWSVKQSRDNAAAPWLAEMTLEAPVPAFPVKDTFQSRFDQNLCTVELSKQISHGKKTGKETTRFSETPGKAVRRTANGGQSELAVQACAQDALSYLLLLRRELAAGRIPPAQTVWFGAAYRVRMEYGGTRQVESAGAMKDADRLVGTVHGPASEFSFELFFGRDVARTLLSARVPLPIGALTLELAQ